MMYAASAAYAQEKPQFRFYITNRTDLSHIEGRISYYRFDADATAIEFCDVYREVNAENEISTPVDIYIEGIGRIISDEYYSIFTDNLPETIRKVESISIGANIKEILSKAFYSDFAGIKSFTSNAVTPPELGEDAFHSSFKECTLYVPAESVAAYKASAWGTSFKAVDTFDETGTTNAARTRLKMHGRTIIADGSPVEVYSITGALIYKGTDTQITLPQKGIYIIRCGMETKKPVCQ